MSEVSFGEGGRAGLSEMTTEQRCWVKTDCLEAGGQLTSNR